MTGRHRNISSIIVAVDGPSGAGKSTVSRAVAENLGLTYIDTGAMYRAVALKAVNERIDSDDLEALGSVAETAEISFKKVGDKNHTFLDGVDVTDRIRSPEISLLTSKISAVPSVRQALTAKQQEMGKKGGVILDGRDIGTVVFPNADYKFFLDAKLEERGRRRHLERGGGSCDINNTIEEISKRDNEDSSRKESPLTRADDAIYIDSTNLKIEEVITVMEKKITSDS